MTSRDNLLNLYRSNTGKTTHAENRVPDHAPEYQGIPARVREYQMAETI